jgi:dual specificity MAP kinase phosphatase
VKKNCLLSSLIQKFRDEQQVNSVSYLHGGFQSFIQKFPQFCINKLDGVRMPNPCQFSLSLPRPNLTPPENLDKPCTEPVEIFDNFLFVGDQEIASNLDILRRFRLTFILNTAKECPNFFEDKPEFRYLRLDLQDCATQNLDMDLFERSFQFIDEARSKNEKVYVHCRAGQSRSATIVISYLIRTFHWSLEKAYRFVQDKRPAVSPNLGFMAQLSKFEKLVLGKSSNVHTLITAGSLPLTPSIDVADHMNLTQPPQPQQPFSSSSSSVSSIQLPPQQKSLLQSQPFQLQLPLSLPLSLSQSQSQQQQQSLPAAPLTTPFEKSLSEYALVCK